MAAKKKPQVKVKVQLTDGKKKSRNRMWFTLEFARAPESFSEKLSVWSQIQKAAIKCLAVQVKYPDEKKWSDFKMPDN